jgi:hypothetical protein
MATKRSKVKMTDKELVRRLFSKGVRKALKAALQKSTRRKKKR